jgi:hypothetical protein
LGPAAALIAVFVTLIAPLADADEADPRAEPDLASMSLDEISRELENPLTNLWSLTLQNNFGLIDGDRVDGHAASNNLLFQPFLPIPVGRHWMITLRPVFPIVTNNIERPVEGAPEGRQTGFGDIQILALAGPDRGDGWVYGLGLTTKFPSATGEPYGQGKYQAGPAGMLFYMGRPWVGGLLVQHWESFAGDANRTDVSRTDVQYIIRRAFGRGWSVGMGPTLTVDWNASAGNKVTFPIGLGVTKTVLVGKTPMKLRLEPQYSVVRPEDFGTEWNIRLQVTPVIQSPFGRR